MKILILLIFPQLLFCREQNNFEEVVGATSAPETTRKPDTNRCKWHRYVERDPSNYLQAQNWKCCKECPPMKGVEQFYTCDKHCSCICVEEEHGTNLSHQEEYDLLYPAFGYEVTQKEIDAVKTIFDDHVNLLETSLPSLIHMAFHDASPTSTPPGKYSMSCFRFLPHNNDVCAAKSHILANEFREIIQKDLMKENLFVGVADLIQGMGALAVDHLSIGTGYTKLLYSKLHWGRPDLTLHECFSGMCPHLPQASYSSTKPMSPHEKIMLSWEFEVKGKMVDNFGLTVHETIALCGAHTVGRSRSFGDDDIVFTETPMKFDNSYFKELQNSINTHGQDNVEAGFVEKNGLWTLPGKEGTIGDAKLPVGYLFTGLSLTYGPESTKSTIRLFAKNLKAWREKFNLAYIKLSETDLKRVGNGFKIRPSREISVAEHFGISLDDEFGNTKQQETSVIPNLKIYGAIFIFFLILSNTYGFFIQKDFQDENQALLEDEI